MKKAILLALFAAFIALCIGILVYGQEEQKSPPPEPPQPTISNTPRLMLRLMDLNNDGRISEEEHKRFFVDADQDKDGFITQKEIMEIMNKKRMEKNGPNVGEDALDFALTTLDGKNTIRLSDYKGKDIVVLVFGSYT